jgi:hypothetical protein
MGLGGGDMASNMRQMCLRAEIELPSDRHPPVTEYMMESWLRRGVHMARQAGMWLRTSASFYVHASWRCT